MLKIVLPFIIVVSGLVYYQSQNLVVISIANQTDFDLKLTAIGRNPDGQFEVLKEFHWIPIIEGQKIQRAPFSQGQLDMRWNIKRQELHGVIVAGKAGASYYQIDFSNRQDCCQPPVLNEYTIRSGADLVPVPEDILQIFGETKN